ncbi:hypothetical protein GGR57DRAFT_500364 [Xylariaceae sp. FL1272]|nr:hypothetical protein GGR57DRAFT_500364 [Xylariaceae sp. FL1272]
MMRPSGPPDGKQASPSAPKPAGLPKKVQTNFIHEILKHYPAENQLLQGTRVEIYCAVCYDDILILSHPSDQLPGKEESQFKSLAVVACGHVFHDECLETSFSYTPPRQPHQCPSCKLKLDFKSLSRPPMVLSWSFEGFDFKAIPDHVLRAIRIMVDRERSMDPRQRQERDRKIMIGLGLLSESASSSGQSDEMDEV